MGRTVMEVGSDGVAIITLLNPPVNSLSVEGNFSNSIPTYIYIYAAFDPMFWIYVLS